MAETFEFFWGGPFSQWFKSPFTFGMLEFNCAEQFMMFMKAVYFEDYETAAKIMKTKNPRDQKALGREVKGFKVTKWAEVASHIVYTGNYSKFTQDAVLQRILIGTKDRTLVEASPHDKIWGIGLASDDPRAQSRATWLGLNKLGETITRLREDLKSDKANMSAISLCTDLMNKWVNYVQSHK